MVRVMPPWGAASKHTLHHRGFLRDGLLSIRRISQPPTPANGLPQASHRGADGSFERSRIPRRTLAWPNCSKNRAHSSALVCAPSGRGGVRLLDIPHSRTACPSATALIRSLSWFTSTRSASSSPHGRVPLAPTPFIDGVPDRIPNVHAAEAIRPA